MVDIYHFFIKQYLIEFAINIAAGLYQNIINPAVGRIFAPGVLEFVKHTSQLLVKPFVFAELFNVADIFLVINFIVQHRAKRSDILGILRSGKLSRRRHRHKKAKQSQNKCQFHLMLLPK